VREREREREEKKTKKETRKEGRLSSLDEISPFEKI